MHAPSPNGGLPPAKRLLARALHVMRPRHESRRSRPGTSEEVNRGQRSPCDGTNRDEWTGSGEYYEYSKAANPIGSGLIPEIPMADFPSRLHEEGPTRVIPFDLSEKLRCQGPATSPALLSNFIRIRPGEQIATDPNATSELYYVIRGRGETTLGGRKLAWCEGDLFTLSCCGEAVHKADEDAALYWVHDEPLLRYLGARAETPRFQPTLYPRAAPSPSSRRSRRTPRSPAAIASAC